MGLSEFLLARIAEDEAVARDAEENAPETVSHEHGVRWQPARVLAECEAKRQLVNAHLTFGETYRDKPGYWPLSYPAAADECATCGYGDEWQVAEFGPTPYPCWTLRILAMPYASHEAYRDEWSLAAVSA